MTEDAFRKSFGPDMRKFMKTPLHAAILSVFEETAPARENMNNMPSDTVTATVLFAREQERQKVTALFRNGLSETPPVQAEREAEYKKEE